MAPTGPVRPEQLVRADRERAADERQDRGPNSPIRRKDAMAADEYLLAGQTSELERLQLQSRVWEPSGQRLLEAIGPGRDRALDVGCGVLGWLRLLSRWVSPDGEVVGTDIDDAMLAAAAQFVADEQLPNVIPVRLRL